MSKSRISAAVKGLALAGAGAAAVLAFAPQDNLPQLNFSPTPAVAQQTEPAPPAAQFSFADVVENVRSAVVSVDVEVERVGVNRSQIPGFDDLPDDHPFRRFFREFEDRFGGQEPRGPQQFSQSQGSGFFISADGYIVTNNHVVENAQTVTIRLDDGSEYTADVIGTDSRTDVALLKVDADVTFDFVEFADSNSDVRVGDWVIAVGNPFGLGGSVTAGIVSARGRDIGAGPYDDFIQIDAPVNRGNSGGPAFNMNGEVIGVNTAIYSPSGGNVGIAFAIPAETVASVIEQLRDTGTVMRGWLGVQIQPVSNDIAESLGLDEASGAIVAQLLDESPARDAGIRRGDTILRVNGEQIDNARDLARTIGSMLPGETAEIIVWRDNREQTIEVELGTQPSETDLAAAPSDVPERSLTSDLGMTLAPGEEGGIDGVMIVDVEPGSPAAERGLETGNVILEVAGVPVATPTDVSGAVDDARANGRNSVLLLVQSGDAVRFVALGLERG
ncbi:MAG: Do family serine endopeptidase [Pseudomonadota bacterium]